MSWLSQTHTRLKEWIIQLSKYRRGKLQILITPLWVRRLTFVKRRLSHRRRCRLKRGICSTIWKCKTCLLRKHQESRIHLQYQSILAWRQRHSMNHRQWWLTFVCKGIVYKEMRMCRYRKWEERKKWKSLT
jgi:hypothetical protein